MSNPDLPHPVTFLDHKYLARIRGYALHERRTPEHPVGIVTPEQTTGPFFPRRLIDPQESDLACITPGGPRAEGDPIIFRGRVLDVDGNPVAGALLEVWQANKHGKYDHDADRSDQPIDPNFRGFGRQLTDAEGRYEFRSIKPAPYLNPGYDNWLRPPHIHFSVFGAGVMQRLITQMYFPDEELNDIDPILNAIENLDARAMLISRRLEDEYGAGVYEFDIRLRGEVETPFFVPD